MGVAKLRIGTRSSSLAQTQGAGVARQLEALGIEVEPVVIRTPDAATANNGEGADATSGPDSDKTRFVRELQLALDREEIDVAVHSAKDLPNDSELKRDLGDALTIAAVPLRESAFDVLCGVGSLDDLASGARVGTNSLRRRSQLLARRPDLAVSPLHGNVDTRLQRLADGDWNAILLAEAGLRRLGLIERIGGRLETFTPAAGQGCLALEMRSGDHAGGAAVRSLNDDRSELCLTAERSWVNTLQASCNTPCGAHAQISDGALLIRGYIGLPDGSEWIADQVTGPSEEAVALGATLGDKMLIVGGREILDRAERWDGA